MPTLKVTEPQLRLIQEALDFYSRVGIGQLKAIKDHPTFKNYLREHLKDEEGNVDYDRFHSIREQSEFFFTQGRDILLWGSQIGQNGSWGIYNTKVDDSCRVAFDLVQVIRHEFWKSDPAREFSTVASSVHLMTEEGDKIQCDLIDK